MMLCFVTEIFLFLFKFILKTFAENEKLAPLLSVKKRYNDECI